MEEKADRQDEISSSLEDAQARLDDAEANISALTAELESSSQEARVSCLAPGYMTNRCKQKQMLVLYVVHPAECALDQQNDRDQPHGVPRA